MGSCWCGLSRRSCGGWKIRAMQKIWARFQVSMGSFLGSDLRDRVHLKDSETWFAVKSRFLPPKGQTRKSRRGSCSQDRERDLNVLSDRKDRIPTYIPGGVFYQTKQIGVYYLRVFRF